MPGSLTYAVSATALAAVGVIAVLLRRQGQQIHENQEITMAQFDQLKQDIAELKAGIADLAARVEAALDRAQDDDADQAAVDSAQAEIRAAIDQMKAIAATPAPEEPPAEGPTA